MSIVTNANNNLTYTVGGKEYVLKFKNYGMTQYVKPPIPDDMDFCYLANNFSTDLGGIPNSVTTSDMGTYSQVGTITKNGSGADCYLSNNSSMSNYLTQTLTSDRLTAMKASSSTYTYYCRVYNSSGMGGIISWRTAGSTNYYYMLRANSGKFQVHDSSGHDLISLVDGDVIKCVISGTSCVATDLDTGTSASYTISSTRNMSTTMLTFCANKGSSDDESHLAKFYGIAGIARETTAEEDEQIRLALTHQVV